MTTTLDHSHIEANPTRNGKVPAALASPVSQQPPARANAAEPAPAAAPESRRKLLKLPWRRGKDGANPSDEAATFYAYWLLLATTVSVGGNVIHALIVATDHLRILAAIWAAAPPIFLLGSTHVLALRIKNRRRAGGYELLDWIVLGAVVLLTFGAAAIAFVISLFALRDLSIILGANEMQSWMWPIMVDVSIVIPTLALLDATSSRPDDTDETQPLAEGAKIAVPGGWPDTEAGRKHYLLSIATEVLERNKKVKPIARLTVDDVVTILEMLDNKEPVRAIRREVDNLHHRYILAISDSAQEVIAESATVPAQEEGSDQEPATEVSADR